MLCIASAADYPWVLNDSRTSYEFVWSDYPIKRLTHNWKLLEGGDCYSVFLTTLSQAANWWGLPALHFDLLPSDWCTSLIRPAGLLFFLSWRQIQRKRKNGSVWGDAAVRMWDLLPSSSSQHFLYSWPYFGNPCRSDIFVYCLMINRLLWPFRLPLYYCVVISQLNN